MRYSAGADDLPPSARRVLIGGVLAVHVLCGWALLQLAVVRQAVLQAAPIMVSLIDAREPPKPLPPPPLATPRMQKPRPAPTPLIAAEPTPAPAPVSFAVPLPEPAPAPVAATAPPAPASVLASALAPAPPAPPAPPVAVAPFTPRLIPASAVRYRVEPKMTVPLLSRRLGEQGIVYLLIVVDATGRLKEARVKNSSGYARLDQAALQDIRSARFVPYAENGQPIEWQMVAPMAYELDR